MSNSHFLENFNILSANIYKIDIYKDNDDLYIELFFNLVYPKSKQVRLKLCKVKEFLFYWNSENIFYNVESYKLFEINNNIYLLSLFFNNSMNLSSLTP